MANPASTITETTRGRGFGPAFFFLPRRQAAMPSAGSSAGKPNSAPLLHAGGPFLFRVGRLPPAIMVVTFISPAR